jgi:hypothetical protein
MIDFNDYIGIEYADDAFIKNDRGAVNCNGLICELSDTYRETISTMKSMLNLRSTIKGLKSFYELIEEGLEQSGDIIIFVRRTSKIYSHIGMITDKGSFIHADTGPYGVVIDRIAKMSFFSYNYLIFREVDIHHEI